MRHLLLLAVILVTASTISAQDVRKLSNAISEEDLNEPCASKFIEIHLDAETDEQAGMAILKLFYLVDPLFLKKSVSIGTNPQSFGLTLSTLFREYCENSGTVSVKTAVKQTILAMEDSLSD